MYIQSRYLTAALQSELVRSSAATGVSVSYAVGLLNQRLATNGRLNLPDLDRLTDAIDLAASAPAAAPLLNTQRAQLDSSLWTMRGEESRQSATAALGLAEQFVHALTTERDLPSDVRRILALELVQWEVDALVAELGTVLEDSVAQDRAITHQRLGAYLSDRFGNAAELQEFVYLSGGYGKETIAFTCRGGALDGDFIMRREMGQVGLACDCTRVASEFRVLEALYGCGFPVPEPCWVDTDHPLLPGGDFMVMRRIAGIPGGTYFGSGGDRLNDLEQRLGDVLGQLHRLRPVEQLGDLTGTLARELWDLSLEECTRRYITTWRAGYMAAAHVPSPALMAVYGWLLEHVPKAEGRPVLLHGDIGFHNFLIDGDQITGVIDWELAHLGDPAEDLAYVNVTAGQTLDFNKFMDLYETVSGLRPDGQRMAFFEIWSQVRNLTICNMQYAQFHNGSERTLKLVELQYRFIPHFLNTLIKLIHAYPEAA